MFLTDRRIDPRTLVAVAYDLIVAILAWTLGFMARWNFAPPPDALALLAPSLGLVLAIQLSCSLKFGLYRGIWRYASMHDMKRIMSAVGVAALLTPLAMLLWRHGLGVPRMLYFIHPLLLIVGMGGGRIVYRWWKEHRQFGQTRRQGRPVLILGIDDATRRLIHELERNPRWTVVGVLAQDGRKVGREVSGAPIMGTWAELNSVAERTGARHAILAAAHDSASLRRTAFNLCEANGVTLLVLPDFDMMLSSDNQALAIRQVELDDLLGREPVSFDVSQLRHDLAGQSVLVTGGAGSIGGELCQQIARFAPAQLVLFDQNEFGLYQAVESLTRKHPELRIIPVMGDVKDRTRLYETFRRFKPQVVFHAAAYKHVPLLEGFNAWEGVRNNALGTQTVADIASTFNVRKLVFVSTDKAVNPTNAMGASKRLAELILQWHHTHARLPVVMVRFGNVLGSSGSVIPKFREQIALGGPITVTHPEMTRYFMSIPEAAKLVLQAGAMGEGGEIFVLDMGEPVRIVDLARDMIRLSGLTEADIAIEFTGIRPGEKLYEELLASDETTVPTRHAKLRIARSLEAPDHAWYERVTRWLALEIPLSDAAVRGWLKHFVPEYTPPHDLGLIQPDVNDLSGPTSPSTPTPSSVRLTVIHGGQQAGER